MDSPWFIMLDTGLGYMTHTKVVVVARVISFQILLQKQASIRLVKSNPNLITAAKLPAKISLIQLQTSCIVHAIAVLWNLQSVKCKPLRVCGFPSLNGFLTYAFVINSQTKEIE